MTILTKDHARVYIEDVTVWKPTGSGWEVASVSQSISLLGGVDGAIPVVTIYPVNPNVTITERGIRLCTQAEVDALKTYKFAGLAEPEASTELLQLLYQEWGKPLQIFSGNDYIAAWYSDVGVGFHYFVGYDPSDYPTQSIETSALQQVF